MAACTTINARSCSCLSIGSLVSEAVLATLCDTYVRTAVLRLTAVHDSTRLLYMCAVPAKVLLETSDRVRVMER